MWQNVGQSAGTEFTVPRLVEGNQYVFRVSAENECGLGEAAELSDVVTAKSQYGKKTKILLHNCLIFIEIDVILDRYNFCEMCDRVYQPIHVSVVNQGDSHEPKKSAVQTHSIY